MKDAIRIICAALIALGGVTGAVVTMVYSDSEDSGVLAIVVIALTVFAAVRIANTSDET